MMKSRNHKSVVLVAALLWATAAPRHAVVFAQGGQSSAAGGGTVSINNQAGRVQIKLERGSRVAVSNRYGRISITGWDKDTVEATATSAKGAAEAVQVEMTADPQSRSTLSLAVVGRGRQSGLFAAGTPFPADSALVREAQQRAREMSKDMERRIEEKNKEKVKERRDKPEGRNETPDGGFVIVQPPSVTVVTPGVTVTAPAAPPDQVSPASPASPARAPQPMPRPAPAPRAGVLVGSGASRADAIHLDVKVPRFAQLETIELRAGDLNVSGIDGPVSVAGYSGDVTVSRVGSLEVRTRSGDINVDGVEGMVYIVASNGDITVRNSNSDVRATSISGDISVSCARGRVDVSNTRGRITLANVAGDVEATTTDAEINFTGPIADGGRYRLKSMEGRVLMAIPEGSPGFTANLMSYNREALTDFQVRNATPNPSTQAARRVEAHHGNGRAVITLDSFGQNVQLTKLAPGATAAATACR